MQQRHDDFEEPPYAAAIRAKLGEALRERYDLTEPLAPGLVSLLNQLDASILAQEASMPDCTGT